MNFIKLEYVQPLCDIMRGELSEKRFSHVHSVAKTAYILCCELGLTEEQTQKTVTASFLHDITREKSEQQQYEMCEKYGISLTEDERKSPSVLHQLTGAEYVKEKYPQYGDESVLDMIRKHCTGAPEMTVCEKIVFLCDYIEPLRNHESCKRLNSFYFSQRNEENIENHLDKAVFLAYDSTVGHLKDKGAFIHPLTLYGRAEAERIIKERNGE